MKNVEIVEIKSFEFKYISLCVQFFLYICLAINGIAFIFIKNTDILFSILYGLLGLTLLIMAYNNKIFFKKKYMTYIYLVFSVILLVSMVVNIIW